MTGRRNTLPRVVVGVVGALLALAPVVARGDVTVTARVEPRRVASDGTVQLRVTVQGDIRGDIAPPALLGLDEWSVITGPSISSQFRFINGVSSTTRSFTWVLGPPGPGMHTVPSLSIVAGEERLQTEPVTIEVYDAPGAGGRPTSDADAPGLPPGGTAEDVFFRTQLEPPEPYVGQQAILKYDLYTRVEVASVPQAQEAPTYPNFWKEELDGPQRIAARIEVIDGQEYHVYTVRKVALFPTASGETVLPPLTFSVPIKSRQTSRFRRSFFFDPVETVYKRAPRLSIHVRPLPSEGRPAGFSNAVGSFSLDVAADRTTARTGDAVGLAVAIEGTGNLNSIKEPALVVPPGFAVYPPETRQSVAPDRDDRFAGTKSWNYILVPREPGEQSLPEVHFAYFDPVAGTYRTLTGGGSAIRITGEPLAEDVSPEGLPARRTIERLGSDIHFIETSGGPLSVSDDPLYGTSWFWVGLLVPPVVNLGALVARWRRRRREERSSLVRRRRARRTALRRLNRATQAAAAADGREFYAAVGQAMTEYVADKCGVQAAGLTYDRMAALLGREPGTADAAREFLEILEACDCARFTPGQDDRVAREQLLATARAALQALEGSR